MPWSRPLDVRKRDDLIGKTGTLKHKVTIVDAKEEYHGVGVKVRDFRGMDDENDSVAAESLGKTRD